MNPLLQVLGGVVSLGVIVCHIIVIVKMFQHGKAGLGIASILTTCCLIGLFITQIYGWMKAKEWGINTLMLTFTIFLILWVVLMIVNPIDYSQFQQQFQQPQLPPP